MLNFCSLIPHSLIAFLLYFQYLIYSETVQVPNNVQSHTGQYFKGFCDEISGNLCGLAWNAAFTTLLFRSFGSNMVEVWAYFIYALFASLLVYFALRIQSKMKSDTFSQDLIHMFASGMGSIVGLSWGKVKKRKKKKKKRTWLIDLDFYMFWFVLKMVYIQKF